MTINKDIGVFHTVTLCISTGPSCIWSHAFLSSVINLVETRITQAIHIHINWFYNRISPSNPVVLIFWILNQTWFWTIGIIEYLWKHFCGLMSTHDIWVPCNIVLFEGTYFECWMCSLLLYCLCLSDHMTCCVVVGCDTSWTITGKGSTAGCNSGWQPSGVLWAKDPL